VSCDQRTMKGGRNKSGKIYKREKAMHKGERVGLVTNSSRIRRGDFSDNRVRSLKFFYHKGASLKQEENSLGGKMNFPPTGNDQPPHLIVRKRKLLPRVDRRRKS